MLYKIKVKKNAVSYYVSMCPFYIVSYYIKWVTTSWTHSISRIRSQSASRSYLMSNLIQNIF